MMRPGRVSARWLGVATLWSPVAAIGLLAALSLAPFILPAGESLNYPKDQLLYFALEAIAMLIVGLLTLAALACTTIFYAFHIARNEGLSKREKVVWSVLNVTLGLFAMPVYWFRHMLPATAHDESNPG
jgi:fatty acid desaturase